jgi:23S rRNA (cytosine1962-C5)-methyltransferase
MTEPRGYVLLDAGDGRRLESFGDWLTDRPAPGATAQRRAPGLWTGASVYRGGAGWQGPDRTPIGNVTVRVEIAGVTMEARPAPSGNVGLFPEHAANAAWLADAVAARRGATETPSPAPIEILNLFAYTGLMTLLAARAGAAVAHVDASRPSVAWARHNAGLSGLETSPVRWLVDDAMAFAFREIRRGRRYAGIILDPPSYGHGSRGDRGAWLFDDRIDELLAACAEIIDPEGFWLLTTHTPGWDPERLADCLAANVRARPGAVEGLELRLDAGSGAVLRLGAAARLDPILGERR